MNSLNPARRSLPLSLLAGAALSASASAQVTFSIDNGSATIGTPDAFTVTPITEGDILTPSTGAAPGPNPAALAGPVPPGTSVNAGFGLGLGAYPGCVGHPTGTPCPVEVDALSYGRDDRVGPNNVLPGAYWFSVDEVARGMPGSPIPPTVFTEGALSGTFEAAADLFTDLGGAPAPMPPFAGAGGNNGRIDGNGLVSTSGFVYPGLGLVEPGGLWPFVGDDVDAADTNPVATSSAYPAYFSLDAAWIDPVLGIPLQGSAGAHGFVGGDVLATLAPGGPPVLYAPAPALGLDVFGPGTDDLDALAMWENGNPGFQPSMSAYDWISGTSPRDMLLFSVRRGSAVIGMPDSRFCIPIEEGDILTVPLPTAFGGCSPFPSIWIAAENLGLQTMRSATLIGGNTGDDLDALDVVRPPGGDCNGNGIPDAIDLASGTSTDWNANGVPDDCELISTAFCFCPSTVAPCGNPYSPGGCRNITGLGAILSGSGTSSVTNDDLFLDVVQMPPSNFGLIFMGPSMMPPVPFGNGLRCVTGNLFRFAPPFVSSPVGSVTVGPMVGLSAGIPGGMILSASTWNFQAWYRDPAGACGANSNASNALGILFTP